MLDAARVVNETPPAQLYMGARPGAKRTRWQCRLLGDRTCTWWRAAKDLAREAAAANWAPADARPAVATSTLYDSLQLGEPRQRLATRIRALREELAGLDSAARWVWVAIARTATGPCYSPTCWKRR
jgi:hypothetical protein